MIYLFILYLMALSFLLFCIIVSFLPEIIEFMHSIKLKIKNLFNKKH